VLSKLLIPAGHRAVGAIVTVALMACASGVPTRDDVAAIQLAAASEMVSGIFANPGSIEAVCVEYGGDWEDPGLPPLTAPDPATAYPDLSYMDGCVDIEGRLVAREGGGQAISVSVGAPELTGDEEAAVTVYTSTGSIDVAVYRCAVRDLGGSWRAERCEMGATS
jgi:hypothetical protein